MSKSICLSVICLLVCLSMYLSVSVFVCMPICIYFEFHRSLPCVYNFHIILFFGLFFVPQFAVIAVFNLFYCSALEYFPL